MQEMYDNDNHVRVTFDRDWLPSYLKHAQYAEIIELKKVIDTVSNALWKNLAILDIWVWDWRVIERLCWIDEIWRKVDTYLWIDIAQNCIDISNRLIQERKLKNCETLLLDAQNISELEKNYDLIFLTRFTLWNFYPVDFSFATFKTWEFSVNKNEKITSVIKQAYEKLNAWWELIIWSAYIDNENTRKIQEECYRAFWWNVITSELDSFTASDAWWRSLRFTKERIYNYFSFIPREKISFVALDTYDFAMMIRIRK